MGVDGMTKMLATEESRAEFAQNAIKFVRQRNFDGLDLVFQYPGHRGSPPEDKQRYTLLLQELQRAFAEEAAATGKDALLLSVGVSAAVTTVDAAYEVEEIGKVVDFINLMTYDFNNGWDGRTGHNAPLYEDHATNWANVAKAAGYWVEMGCPAEKIILGMALYGRGYTLADKNDNGYGAWTVGPNEAGPYTSEKGYMAYYEICEKMDRSDAVRVWDDVRKVPHLLYGDQWMGYDDEQSLEAKVEFMKTEGFGGWMVWSLDSDDFTGFMCGEGKNKYPLLKALNQV